jgi:hypothetical protein
MNRYIRIGRQEGFYDDCLNENLARCSLLEGPNDNSACDTWVVGGYRSNAATDPELAGGNEFLISCLPGNEPVIVGYEDTVPPAPILDCQPVS